MSVSGNSAVVSVVICTWNRASQLRETLDSLLNQRGVDASRVEVIVVDNNSTDSTRDIIERSCQSWTLGQLHYVFEPRQGKQFALNQGYKFATAPVVAFTDDDIIFPPQWLARIMVLFSEQGTDLAGGKTLIKWPAQGRPVWYSDDMQAILGGVDLGDQRLNPAPPSFAPGGANLAACRDLFQRVGLFSETHFRHMDFEFGMRCQQAGVRVVYDPNIFVYAPVDPAMLTRRYFRRWSFKSGISRSGGINALRGDWRTVPRWLYRQLVEDAWFVWVTSRGQPPAVSFSRELRLWRALGTITNVWHARIRAGSHAAWVERHSQKKNNVY